ncbi:MAG: PilZ domain-containing protein [Acidobacteriota bacterium]
MVDERRRRKRVSVGFPVKIVGLDGSGKPFEEMTRSIDVSPGGVKCLVKAQVKLSSHVTITLPLPRDMRPTSTLDYTYTSKGVVARVEESAADPGKLAIVVKFVR